MSQVSSSVKFPHSLQKRTRSLTSAIAAASAPASSFDTCSRWNASRCAVRCPTPGRRVSCATRFSTAGDSTAPIVPVPFGLQRGDGVLHAGEDGLALDALADGDGLELERAAEQL